ncbi:MAG: type II toxin-antitoxin system RelE/ParE family toxin [Aliivibrio sp.]|nr:type II toxin-antitoxin system RelE/ParE family toxin [Aliivibrio sp.]
MYKLSNKAADDFGNIYEFTYLNFGEEQADKYTDDIEKCLNLLAHTPLIGRECPELSVGIRRFDHQKHAIFYRLREEDIFIVRILNQQMNPMIHLLA